MESLIQIQKRIVPDLLETLEKRYQILHTISLMQPVGRRSLSARMGMTERVLRGEIDFLKEQKLIDVKSSGMTLSHEGKIILFKLEEFMREMTGVLELETKLKSQLNIKDVVVISGDSDTSPWVKFELGRACVKRIKSCLADRNVIAVMGGTTMAAVAEAFTPDFHDKEIVFVPARGGLGEDVKNQANTIVSKMAEKSGGKHRVLYVPEQVSQEIYESVIEEPSIKEVLTMIQSANIVIHGIGEAKAMAERRRTEAEIMEKITRGKAVGEAFGYYFNEEGKIVHKVRTIGLQLRDLNAIPHIFAVAGGKSKAKAIKAYMKIAPPNTVLITDEAVAKRLLKG